MFDHVLESSHRDDSNKWSNIGFGEEITHVELIEVCLTYLMELWWSIFQVIILMLSFQRQDEDNVANMNVPVADYASQDFTSYKKWALWYMNIRSLINNFIFDNFLDHDIIVFIILTY